MTVGTPGALRQASHNFEDGNIRLLLRSAEFFITQRAVRIGIHGLKFFGRDIGGCRLHLLQCYRAITVGIQIAYAGAQDGAARARTAADVISMAFMFGLHSFCEAFVCRPLHYPVRVPLFLPVALVAPAVRSLACYGIIGGRSFA